MNNIIDFNKWGKEQAHQEIDYPALARHALSQARNILESWLPGGKFVGREYLCAGTTGGVGTSCSTNVLTGVGGDFATDQKWGDLISMVSKAEGIPMREAAAKIAQHIGVDLMAPLPPLPPIVTTAPEDKYLAGRETAKRLMDESIPCPPTHEYLVRKAVKPAHGVLLHERTGNMLVPLQDEHGGVWSVQRIYPDGTKKINDGGKLSGNFFAFPGATNRVVYLAEGYATAATVNELTNATTIMGISSGNLPTVAEAITRMYPNSTLVVAGDADDAGRKTAEKIQAKALFPPIEGQDWNDYGTKNPDMARKLLSLPTRIPMLVDTKTMSLQPPEFLIEDAIETPITGSVFGASGSGKSFFVLDLGLHCAAGIPWLGKAVKEGVVILICGEGRHAIPRRIAAWESVHGEIPKNRFFMSQRRIQFDPETIKEMAAEITETANGSGPPVLIIVDTMARSLPGDADENSAKDTMAFVDLCDELQNKYNCVVLIVHHTGHSEAASKRARGSSALKGAMDLEILMEAGKGTIEWVKTKDSEPHLPIKYELVKTEYGKGKRDNSCVVKYDINYDPTTENMTKPAKVGAQTLSTLCHKLGTTIIPMEVWKEEFFAEYGGSETSRRMPFKRAKDDLEKIRYIEIRGENVHVKKVKIDDDAIEKAMFGHLLVNNSD